MTRKTNGQMATLASAKPGAAIRVMHYGELFFVREIITLGEERAKDLGAPVGSIVLVIN
jgi:hypothetical protein